MDERIREELLDVISTCRASEKLHFAAAEEATHQSLPSVRKAFKSYDAELSDSLQRHRRRLSLLERSITSSRPDSLSPTSSPLSPPATPSRHSSHPSGPNPPTDSPFLPEKSLQALHVALRNIRRAARVVDKYVAVRGFLAVVEEALSRNDLESACQSIAEALARMRSSDEDVVSFRSPRVKVRLRNSVLSSPGQTERILFGEADDDDNDSDFSSSSSSCCSSESEIETPEVLSPFSTPSRLRPSPSSSDSVLSSFRTSHDRNVAELERVQLDVFSRLEADFNDAVSALSEPESESSNSTSSPLVRLVTSARLFSVVGLPRRGSEIYSRYVCSLLREATLGMIECNLSECVILKMDVRRDKTFNTLLSSLIDQIAYAVENNSSFVRDQYGKEGIRVFVSEVQRVASEVAKEVIDPFVDRVRKMKRDALQTSSRGSGSGRTTPGSIASVITPKQLDRVLDEVAVVLERFRRFTQWLKNQFPKLESESESEFEVNLVSGSESESELELELDQKECEERLTDLMSLFLEIQETFFRRTILRMREEIAIAKRRRTMLDRRAAAKANWAVAASSATAGRSDHSNSHDGGSATARTSASSAAGTGDDSDSDSGDENVEESHVLVTPLIHDLFYLFKQSLERARATGDAQVIRASIIHIDRLLGSDVHEMIADLERCSVVSREVKEKRIRRIYRRLQLQPGSTLTPETLAQDDSILEPPQLFSIVVLLNDLQTTEDYLKKLVEDVRRKCARVRGVEVALKLLDDGFVQTSNRYSQEWKKFVEKRLFEGYILVRLCPSARDRTSSYRRPRSSGSRARLQQLGGVLADAFNEANYSLSENEFVALQRRSAHSWCAGWKEALNGLLEPISLHACRQVYEELVRHCARWTVSSLRRLLKRKSFTVYGGLLFDGELRDLQKYFGSKMESLIGGGIREIFVAISQVASLLRAAKVGEYSFLVDEFFQLTKKEVDETFALRKDLTD